MKWYVAVLVLLGALYQAHIVRVPTLIEYNQATLEKREAWAEAFGVEDFKSCLEAGLLIPNQEYDLNLPPNKTAIQFNRWQRELNDTIPGTVNLKERQAWKQLKKDFKSLTKWVNKNVR